MHAPKNSMYNNITYPLEERKKAVKEYGFGGGVTDYATVVGIQVLTFTVMILVKCCQEECGEG